MGWKVILVLNAGFCLDLSEVERLVDAILYIWYPGQEGATPSGKLPISFPRLTDLPAFGDYDKSCRTYRYNPAERIYPFGYSLSYTTFEYSDLQLTQSENIQIIFTLTNTGTHRAAEVAQLYLSALDCPFPTPSQRLVQFLRMELDPGESRQIEMTLLPEQLAVVDNTGRLVPPSGLTRLSIGGCSPSALSPAPLVAEIRY